ncbi:MAG: hypothetical protein M0Z88_09875 [Actinomycetota bacterium]|nr:hypothetical protein [Actinomycetota bacterium]MDA8397648.1 hypothetical protein [Actinomycetota bacterium]
MTFTEVDETPLASARIVYLGPVAPHWEVYHTGGERKVVDAFRQRVLARLMLLPPHDPQFKRNRDRIMKDSEIERVTVVWDLGTGDE